MIKSILFLILVLLVTCNDQQYALKYVTVLYDAGTAMPSGTFKNAKNGYTDWLLKCWKKTIVERQQKGCITDEDADKLEELVNRTKAKYSDFLPVYDATNKTKYKFVYTGGSSSPSFESFYRYAQAMQNKPKQEVVVPGAQPKDDMEVDNKCDKRDLLLILADHATNTTKKENFKTFLQEAGKMTGEEITAKNYMERISLALMEQRSFPDNSHDAKKLLIDHNEAIMAHNRMLMGQLDDSIIQNGLKLGQEIRKLRGYNFFDMRYKDVKAMKNCLAEGPRCRDPLLNSISSNTMAMNSMLIELGLEKYIAKAADYFPTPGKSINIELYQKTDDKNLFIKVVIFDPSDLQNYIDATKDVKVCAGKDFCEYTLYENLAFSKEDVTVDCEVLPNNADLYTVPTTTTTAAPTTTAKIKLITDESFEICKCDGTDTSDNCKKRCKTSWFVEQWREYGWKFVAAIILIALVVIAFIVGCSLMIYRCATRLSKEDKMMQKWVEKTLEIGVLALVRQFCELNEILEKVTKDIKDPQITPEIPAEIKMLMRYPNIFCLENDRVKVKHPGTPSEWIHANYVGMGKNKKRFIATQGPLELVRDSQYPSKNKNDTMFEFWGMIIQENVEFIVMLTQCSEGEDRKCAWYWAPQKADMTQRGVDGSWIKISYISDDILSPDEPHVRRTEMEVTWSGSTEGDDKRKVSHIHWSNWPDHTAPTAKTTGINILKEVLPSQHPIVVHCSAGIGRTGTFMSVAVLQEEILSGKPGDMTKLLSKMRESRYGAVQTIRQFVYVHDVFISLYMEKDIKRKLSKKGKKNYEQWLKDMGKDSSFDAPKKEEEETNEKGKGKSKKKVKGKSNKK